MKIIYNYLEDPLTTFHPPAYTPERLAEMVELTQQAYEVKNFTRTLYLAEKILADFPDNKEARKYRDLVLYGLEYPELLILETTNHCRMNCVGCTAKKANGFMEMDNFKKVVDEVCPHLKILRLYNHGDSFYHPDIYRMIDYLSRFNPVQIYISTHGCFENFDAEALARSGTNLFLDFSIDGATQKSYRKYRRNGDIELVFENMRKLMDAKRKYKTNLPFVQWKYIVMGTNEHEMEMAIEKAKELEIDALSFVPFSIGWFISEDMTAEELKAYVDKTAPTDRRFFHNDYDAILNGFTGYKGVKAKHCYNIGRRKPHILWNGDVNPCPCAKPPYQHIMGNVFETGSFKAVWDSEKYRKFRKHVVLDCTDIRPCDNCHLVN